MGLFNPIPEDFTSLDDTPTSYSGTTYFFLKVNDEKSGVIFAPVEFADIGMTTASGHGDELVFFNEEENMLDFKNLSFLELLDTPTTYSGLEYVFLKANDNKDGIEFTPIMFENLNDVPTYSGSENRIPRIKSDASGIEFVDVDNILSCSGNFFDGYSTDDSVYINSGWTDVPINVERIKTSYFSHNINSPEVSATVSGVFVIVARVTVEQTSGNNRSDARMRIMLDSGSGYEELDGTLGSMYSRNNSQDESSATVAIVQELGTGHKIKVQAERNSGGGTLKLLSEGSSLSIFTTKGPRGEKGDPGSGTQIIVKDEGINVNNTPHGALNFIGAGVIASDGGSDTANITIPGSGDSGVFGFNFNEVSDDTTSYTTSTSYIQKIRMSLYSLPAGKYRVGWSFEWSMDNSNFRFEARVQIDDLITCSEIAVRPSESSWCAWEQASGFYYADFASGNHCIDIDYKSTHFNKTASIRRARLEFWRIS